MPTTPFRVSLCLAAKRATLFLVGLVHATACGGAATERGGLASDETTTSRGGGLVGNPAPDFNAPAVGSKQTVSLIKLRGQVVVIDFWGTFCEPCKKSFPRLQELSRKYSGERLKVVGISEDEAEDKDKIPAFAEAYGAKFLLVWDENKAIARAYNPETMPTSVLVDKKGIVRFVHVGYHQGEEAQLEREVRELLAQ